MKNIDRMLLYGLCIFSALLGGVTFYLFVLVYHISSFLGVH